MILNKIFKNSNYDDTQFTDAQKQRLESRITIKNVKGIDIRYTICSYTQKRNKANA